MERKESRFKRVFAFLLAFAMCVSGITITPAGKLQAEAADKISISSAEELKKIGIDPSYPMNGDYVLTADIDLGGENWTPIGGSGGPEYGLVSGERVFNGTFDGAGHAIDNLTITFNGAGSANERNQSGLFAMIGSDEGSDYAKVSNLVFREASINHNLGKGDSIGTLAGDVNGYVLIDNIAVLSGEININKDYTGGDLVGVGGIAGQVRNNGNAVRMTNLYNAANIAANASNPQIRCGGILGRIHQSAAIGELSSCLNTGQIAYQRSEGYAILGYSSSPGETSSRENLTNCYFRQGTGQAGAAEELTQEQMGSEDIKNDLGKEYWMISEGQILPIISTGKVIKPMPSPEFAEGDRASAVTKDFTLPISYDSGNGVESITWTSSKTEVISIAGGSAVVHPVLEATPVTLTGRSESGTTKIVTVTVLSNLSLELDQEYAKPGTKITAAVKNAPVGTGFSYRWEINGRIVSENASYTPAQADQNQFIKVTARMTDTGNTVDMYELYCSKLPVVYIDTNDGYGITSKTVYKPASMRVQGSDRYNSADTPRYDGGISIRGRGNSTWNMSFNKLPYKIKLDSKTNLLGLGESKHWVLLANYLDESLLRNKISYNLSGAMGMVYLPSAHVDVILNGTYAGNYQLVGNVRIEKNRVDIHDWEGCAEDAAKAIGKKEGISGDKRDRLEEQLNANMAWITSDTVNFDGKSYKVSNYYALPKDENGEVDLSGGFLLELDSYFDEVSKFRTNSGQPIMFKSPEFAVSNKELFESARNFIQAVEDSFRAPDFYKEYQGKSRHYTDLVDMDSLVRYFMLNEFFWNTETMKKSTYMYKDLGGKLFIGPIWDMDWSSNSLVSAAETWNPRVWMTNDRSSEAQAQQWYKFLIQDPYFAAKVYECYKENRQNFQEIINAGGIIDQDKVYLKESAQANFDYHYLGRQSDFETETERLGKFLGERLTWMDQQFESVESLIRSLGKFQASNVISVSADTSKAGTTLYTASVTGNAVPKVGFYVNGILTGSAVVSGGKAVFTAGDELLEQEDGKLNVVQVRGMQVNGSLISDGKITDYAVFEKEIVRSALTGTVAIEGEAKTGSVLSARVTDSNNTGVLSYQWMANGTLIEGATSETLLLTEGQIGAVITVEVSSTIETGSIVSAPTGAVVKDEVKNDHIIINQVYGGGNNDGTPISHSFIELYNPMDKDVDLSTYSLGYLSNGKGGTALTEVKLSLNGNLPAYHSYLIRCEPQDPSTPELIKFSVDTFDQEWEQAIDNKRYRLVLYRQDRVEDGVSVNEGNVEGTALEDGTISKQKSIRRTNFVDTNNNAADFIGVDYRESSSDNFPRSLKDGAWPNGEPEIKELEGTIAIRGNAIVGAILYADEAVKNNTGTLKFQWMKDGLDISGQTGQFLILDESCEGKEISVRVESTVETGSIISEKTASVRVVKAQREHLIINQIYGGGQTKKGGAALSHSFIELYNPTEETIALTGYRISYLSQGEENDLDLSGQIAPRSSYLIRCAEEKNNEANLIYTLTNADQTWDQVISNESYSVVLRKGTEQIDGAAVNETPVEGTALTDPENDEIISKNKSIRRIGFVDTDQNADDFEVLNYTKITSGILERIIPRSAADGTWGLGEDNPPAAEFTVSFVAEGVVTRVKVQSGSSVSAIANPVKEGYTFTGWYLGQQPYDFTSKVTRDITLEARWTKNADKPDKPDQPSVPEVLSAPSLSSVKSQISKGKSRVLIQVKKVKGASSYQIYRKQGKKTKYLGKTLSGSFYDEKPVAAKVTYLAKASGGTAVSAMGKGKSITLPKGTAKVSAKAVKGEKAVEVSWKNVKGATGYMVFRSVKSSGGYKRIAVIKKGKTLKHTDRKVMKNKKYYYRVISVKKKLYGPAKTAKVVRVK